MKKVFEALFRRDSSVNRKTVILNAYLRFCDFKGISPPYVPKYRRVKKLPYVPTEKKIDCLISALGRRKLSTMLQVCKETGARVGEIWNLKWVNISFEKATLTINDPEKGSNPRQFKVTQRLLNMIRRLPQTCNYIFRKSNVSKWKVMEIVCYDLRKKHQSNFKTQIYEK